MNKIKQHSRRWHIIKQYNFGANDIASLLGCGFNDPSQVVQNKITGVEPTFDESTQRLLDRGTRYEPVVRDLFCQRHGVSIRETGLLRHRNHDFITASPDGFCSNPKGVFGIGPFLVEYKVRSELSVQIPLKYWIQMQVQMEVWNVDHCVYCENVIEEQDHQAQGVWKLKEYREHVVARDPQWWQSVLPKIQGYWRLVEVGRAQIGARTRARKRKRDETETASGETMSNEAASNGSNGSNENKETVSNDEAGHEVKKRRLFLESKEQLIQPYMLGNYFRSDPLLDWLNLYGPTERRDTDPNPFMTMIRNKNRTFNHLVCQHILGLYPDSTTNACPEPFQPPSSVLDSDVELYKLGFTFEALERTRAAMSRQVPIILNPCFMSTLPSYPYPFGGRADMIILNHYVPQVLGVPSSPDSPDNAYVVVNFRYATINLRADRTHLLNNAKQRVYKAHIWLLNAALGVQQGHVPVRGYIIGRKYDFRKRGVTYRITNALEGVGTVDFDDGGVDEEYEQQCREALEWLQTVRSTDAPSWDPFRPETSEGTAAEPHMYPNMKNMSDYPWHSYKEEIAQHIKEVTSMYHCGPKVRKYAHERGVTEWTRLTPETIKYRSGPILDRIMQFVQMGQSGGSAAPAPAPAPAFGTAAMDRMSKKGYIRGRPCVEFYLDFEAIGNLYDDFSRFPESSDGAMIFLIGLIVVNNVQGTRRYQSYLVDKLNHSSERQMVSKMLSDIQTERQRHDQDFAPVYFWSNAENYMLRRAMGPDVVKVNHLVMVDLCKAFKECGLVLPGQIGYGLKSVAKTMYSHGMISTTWKTTNQIADGLNAAIEAAKTYDHRDDASRRNYFRELIDYNYVDCKVMEEILEYLRSQQSTPPQ